MDALRRIESELKTMQTQKFHLRIDKVLYIQLAKAAKEDNRSINQQICYILKNYLQ